MQARRIRQHPTQVTRLSNVPTLEPTISTVARRWRCALILTCAVITASTRVGIAQPVHNVDADATGANDGPSRADADTDLQAGLAAAEAERASKPTAPSSPRKNPHTRADLAGSHEPAGLLRPGCGSDLSAEDAAVARANQEAGIYELPPGSGDSVYHVAIAFHVVRRSDGTGGLSEAYLENALADINTLFAPVGMVFCRVTPTDYIDSNFFYYQVNNFQKINQLRSTNVVPDALNCYFTENLSLYPYFPLCGIGSFTWWDVQGIVLANDCTSTLSDHSLFAHEIGHYFDLWHTFETEFGCELPDGSNCTEAGDLLCDTPADPGIDFLTVDAACEYVGEGGFTGCAGAETYSPLPDNLMSYAPRPCITEFTPQQRDKMVATLLNLRPEIIIDACAPPGQFDLLTPAPASGEVGASPTFDWTDAPGADEYQLVVDDNAEFAHPLINVTTLASTYTPDTALSSGRYYFWHVQARNACGQTLATPRQTCFLTNDPMPAVLHVDDSAPAGGAGGAWSSAINKLQPAIDVAAIADGVVTEVHVGQGTYRPAGPDGDQRRMIRLEGGVTLVGGYAGYGSTDPNARDVTAFPSILSGDLNGNDGPPGSGQHLGDNSYRILDARRAVPASVLDGLTVRAANATDNWRASGALVAYDALLTIRNSAFLDNRTDVAGAAIVAVTGSLTLENCRVERNTAAIAVGGLAAVTEQLVVTGCTFSDNTANWSAGAVYSVADTNATILNCVFYGNSAGQSGGAFRAYLRASTTFVNSLFDGNIAEVNGGAVRSGDADTSLINCTIVFNHADRAGGGLHASTPGSLSIVNSIVWNNTADSGSTEAQQVATGPGATLFLDYCDVMGWTGLLGGVGNLGLDPLFVDADGPDDVPGTLDDNLRLDGASPCLHAGNTLLLPLDLLDLDDDGDTAEPLPLDLDGQPRVVPPSVDLGAYERP